MSDDMIKRARRIVAVWADARERNSFYEWAEALLAEHDARVAAERERDRLQRILDGLWGRARTMLASLGEQRDE